MLNVNNFYNLFLFFLDGAVLEDFLLLLTQKIFVHANIANELIELLYVYQPEFVPTTCQLRSDYDKGKKDDYIGKKDDNENKKDDNNKKNDEDNSKKSKMVDFSLHRRL